MSAAGSPCETSLLKSVAQRCGGVNAADLGGSFAEVVAGKQAAPFVSAVRAVGLDTEEVFFDDNFETVPDVKLINTRWPIGPNGLSVTGRLGEQGLFKMEIDLNISGNVTTLSVDLNNARTLVKGSPFARMARIKHGLQAITLTTYP